MKGCIIILVLKAGHLEAYDPKLLSIIKDYKKFLVVNDDLIGLLNESHHACYDQIDFVNTRSTDELTIFFDTRDLERILKLHCETCSPDKTYIFSCDEFNLEIVADLTTKLGAHGLNSDMAPFFRNKYLMKKYLRENSKAKLPECLLIDKSYDYQSLSSILGKSFAVKPISHAASIGFHIISNEKDWDSLLKSEYFSQFDYEAETLLVGELCHADTVRVNHKNVALVISEYLFPQGKFINQKPIGSIILKEENDDYNGIFELNKNVLDAFDVDGCFHLECFKLPDNSFVFLEIAWRQAGLPVLYNFSQIYDDYSQSLVEVFATVGYKIPEKKVSGYKELRFLLPKKKGIFKGLNLPDFKSECKEKFFIKEGEMMGNPLSIIDAAVEVTLINENYDELLEDFMRLRKVSLYKS